MPRSLFTHLACGACGREYPRDRLWNLCLDCQRPLLARYDLGAARAALTREALARRPPGLWRYAELLPVEREEFRIGLGEGGTPLLCARRLGEAVGCPGVLIKDESLNPTGSFKARGLAVAVARARELGARSLAIPTAGNAGGALSAYAALAGLEAHVFMPRDVPPPFRAECEALGARVTLVDGLITDCAARVREGAERHGWFDLSTLREPYRLEGKKTLGYELAEQLSGSLPDVVIYPTGGGTGLVGMWKAFEEMEALGWIEARRPRMVSVQSTGCAPIVKAFREGKEHAETWPGARTVADGLRVPQAVGDFLILRALRESGGTALAVEDREILDDVRLLASRTGVFPAPEGAACLTALRRLLQEGWIRPDERVVLFNTGTGLKYAHRFAAGEDPRSAPEERRRR